MEVVANNYLPGDQRLIDKIVYELKAQGIFDQFRKECFADVDTKPAYQNLRQRVEGSVSGFLREQSWRPDMNKNQVREMLRKTITESGFLETGVERIVDQVVNPKINSVFLPKVEEIVYSYLGIKKPSRNEVVKHEHIDLLPNDLEAVSPESEPVDKKDDKSTDTFQDLDESKTEEDESPPFEPLEEQSVYVPHEENSVDSHLSGFSGLISHESNQSNENKVTPMEQDSQMSRNSSDSRLSIVTSDENSKMEVCEDSQSKSVKSNDSNSKHDSDKNKQKSSERHKSRSESKSDRDRKSSKDSKSTHSSSSKEKDKSRDRKDSKSTSNISKNDKDKDKPRDKNDKDRKTLSGTNSKHSSHSSNSSSSSSKDKNGKKESRSDKDRDKSRPSSSHKDSKSRDKSSDSRSKEKSSDKHKHSSSHSDRHKRDKDNKDKKKDKPKDDHYSSRDKKNDRRSTDRDSNDGQSSRQNSTNLGESHSSQNHKGSQDSNSGGGDSGNSDQSDNTTKAPINISQEVESSEVTISAPDTQKVKVFKPKCASNMQEALRLRKIRKQLARLEKQNQLSLASVDVNSSILLSASINLDDLNQNCISDEKIKQESLNSKMVAELEVVPSPLQNTVISQDNWDAMEAKLREEVCSEFKEYNDDSLDDSVEEAQVVAVDEKTKEEENTEEPPCKYFDSVDIKQIEFLQFVEKLIKEIEKERAKRKRKVDDNDWKNNNNNKQVVPEKKAKVVRRIKEKINNHSANNQRYSSDDLYKPRPTFASSRRRGAKNLEN
ncbi:dentin sialophosphoprotein isoform X2 [Zophobas morio]|uniref:dentin sialophosphoprotein isoform X2 n=1 Tax=Zophobas morio TaxID=2755281 RepID=UPI00308306A6